MTEDTITPALLRADAERMRDAAFEAAGEFGQAEADPFIRAAAALEEQAARMEADAARERSFLANWE